MALEGLRGWNRFHGITREGGPPSCQGAVQGIEAMCKLYIRVLSKLKSGDICPLSAQTANTLVEVLVPRGVYIGPS